MNRYRIEDELTGLEEHLRDEAWECGELAAMRAEADAEWEDENHNLLAEEEAYQAEWAAQQADPMRAVCDFGRDTWMNLPKCCENTPDEDSDLPF